MASAEYCVTHRLGDGGVPLLVMTTRVEHEIILGANEINILIDSLRKPFDDPEKGLHPDDAKFWIEEIGDMKTRLNETDGIPLWARFEMQPVWRAIPRAHITTILEWYSKVMGNPLTFYVAGRSPEYSVAFNWGGRTVSVPIGKSDIATARTELEALSAAASDIEQAQNKDNETKRLAKEVWNSASTTIAVTKCAKAIGEGALKGGYAGAATGIGACLGAVAAIAGLFDSEEKRRHDQRDAEERAMRMRQERQQGIDRAEDFDLADRFRRTA